MSTARKARRKAGQPRPRAADPTATGTGSRESRSGASAKRARPEPARSRPPAPGDAHLPPWERGPARAFVRGAVDARGPRLVLLFMPAFAMALITWFGPASELGDNLLIGSLVALAVVAVDAVLLGSAITRAAREQFPNDQVSWPATTWYVFMRAHRPRSMRRPPPGS